MVEGLAFLNLPLTISGFPMTFRSKPLAVALIALVHASLLSFAQTAPPAVPTIPAQRLAHLRRGINLSEWFAQVYDPKGYTKEHFETWTTADDIALIRAWASITCG